MFWNSIALMTVVDVLIIMITLFVWTIFFKQRETLFRLGLHVGSGLILFGLTTITLLYLVDLAVMHLASFFVPMERGMAIMMSIHLNYSWPVTLIGTGFLAVGLYYLMKVLFPNILGIIKEAEQARAEAEQANNAKSNFLANMSHELRTPLNAIIGFSDIMRADTLDFGLHTQARDYSKDIFNSGTHLLSIVNDILDLSMLEANGLEMQFEEFTLSSVFDECLPFIKKLALENDVRLSNTCKCDKAILVHCDPVRLRQVVLNLMSNAVKYNKKGGTVTVWCEMASPNMGRLIVKDTGIGIPATLQASLFEPFIRDSRVSVSSEGTGIGLSISNSIMQAMDGDIGFESLLNEGSSFWIDVPLAVNQGEEKCRVNG